MSVACPNRHFRREGSLNLTSPWIQGDKLPEQRTGEFHSSNSVSRKWVIGRYLTNILRIGARLQIICRGCWLYYSPICSHSIFQLEEPFTISNFFLWFHLPAVHFGFFVTASASVNSKFLRAALCNFILWIIYFMYCLRFFMFARTYVSSKFCFYFSFIFLPRCPPVWFIFPSWNSLRFSLILFQITSTPAFTFKAAKAGRPAMSFSFSTSTVPKVLRRFQAHCPA